MGWQPQLGTDARSPRSKAELREAIGPRLVLSPELLQEAEVVFQEQAQVRDAVLEHLDSLRSHAERETLVALRIEAAVLEYDRVDHACPEDRHPASAAAGRAANAPAHETFHVER